MHLGWTKTGPHSSCPTHILYMPHLRTQHKGLPDTQVLLFPLYCSSTGLEVCLDLQRALKRLRGWGQDRNNLDEETERSGGTGRGCLEVITVIPEGVIRNTNSGEQGKRGNGRNSNVPMPLAPARRHRLGNHRGKRWENGCPGVFFSTLAHQTPFLSRTPFYHVKMELTEGAK